MRGERLVQGRCNGEVVCQARTAAVCANGSINHHYSTEPPMVVISTGMVADSSVNCDLAYDVGSSAAARINLQATKLFIVTSANKWKVTTPLDSGMLILVLVLKDSLRTFFKSLPLPWSLGSGSCPCPGPWGSGPCPCPSHCGSGPCPYPGPCVLVLVLVLVFSPCKDLFPLFHYSDLFAYYCSVNAYN